MVTDIITYRNPNSGIQTDGLSEEEFFQGFSVLRNKELMRIFKDLDLVEQLGSVIPRILESYNKGYIYFSENFQRIAFPKGDVFYPRITKKVTKIVTKRVTKKYLRSQPYSI